MSPSEVKAALSVLLFFTRFLSVPKMRIIDDLGSMMLTRMCFEVGAGFELEFRPM